MFRRTLLDPTLSRQRDALAGIVAMLVAWVGLIDGKTAGLIKKGLRTQVLRILRPAEAAARRLIFVAAQGVDAKPVRPRAAPDFRAIRTASSGSTKAKSPRFQLADAMVPMVGHRVYSDAASGNVPFTIRAPHIYSVAPIDPTIPAFLATRLPKPQKPDREVIHSVALVRRLQAITFALESIPRQAQRLARWTARRERLSKQRPIYTSPLRPGPPPGYRKEPELEIDRILAACHLRAFDARLKVNTS